MSIITSGIVIIGAGLTGLTLAYLLRDSNFNVSIVETRTRKQETVQTSKEEIPNLDERSAQSRAAGNTQQQQQVVETIVRDKPKIGRNDRVTIKHVMNGENKTLKYKQAEPLIAKGDWVLVED